jgi:hypothetical protein
MIYVDTRRLPGFPNDRPTVYGTTILLGMTAVRQAKRDGTFGSGLRLNVPHRVVTSIAFRALFFGWEIWTSLRAARSLGQATAPANDRILPPWLMREKRVQFGTPHRTDQKVHHAPGQALSDFHICQLIAHYWGCGGMFSQWSSPESVFRFSKKFREECQTTSPASAITGCLTNTGGIHGR